MTGFTVPVSMLAPKGAGAALAAGVIGLLILLALSAKSTPSSSTAQR